MVVIGMIGATAMTLLFITFNTGYNLWTMRAVLFVRGLSMAFAVIAVQAAVFTNISPAQTGRASAFFNTDRQVASSFGVAILGAILFELIINKNIAAAQQITAFHISFIGAAVLGVISVIFALTIRDEDAAATLTGDKMISPAENPPGNK